MVRKLSSTGSGMMGAGRGGGGNVLPNLIKLGKITIDIYLIKVYKQYIQHGRPERSMSIWS